ncbi:hypothetical protein KJ765_06610 [Candidatus Micrarchaeota archaeon]|nr:hypothetical protein [Candidatus Micrarchaeota archaeon]
MKKKKFRERLKRISVWGHIFVAIGDFLAGLALGAYFSGLVFDFAIPLLIAGIALHLPAVFEIFMKS